MTDEGHPVAGGDLPWLRWCGRGRWPHRAGIGTDNYVRMIWDNNANPIRLVQYGKVFNLPITKFLPYFGWGICLCTIKCSNTGHKSDKILLQIMSCEVQRWFHKVGNIYEHKWNYTGGVRPNFNLLSHDRRGLLVTKCHMN